MSIVIQCKEVYVGIYIKRWIVKFNIIRLLVKLILTYLDIHCLKGLGVMLDSKLHFHSHVDYTNFRP
jgi:hypothetical protein